jgi:hypothetical protein
VVLCQLMPRIVAILLLGRGVKSVARGGEIFDYGQG